MIFWENFPEILITGQLIGYFNKSRESFGIFLLSFAHSPKSINLQRLEQKGLNLFSGYQLLGCLQIGQLIFLGLFIWLIFIRQSPKYALKNRLFPLPIRSG